MCNPLLRRRRFNLLPSVLAIVLLAAAPVRPGAAAEEKVSFQIESQDLQAALNQFALQSKRDVLFSPDITLAKRSTALHGEYAPESALRVLLTGTGLTYRAADERTILVERTGDGARQPDTSGSTSNSSNGMEGLRLARANGQNAANPQTANSTAPARTGDDVQEVIVTAQKREERLIEVPQAVTVLSTAELVRNGALQFRDYADTIPGLSFKTIGAGYTQVTMRGITSGEFDLGPTVGIYVDEVPYGSSSTLTHAYTLAFDSSLFDLDRIEVLKGPQGTYYGASSMGGLIKYVSKRPTTDAFKGEVQTGIASTEHGGMSYNGALAANVPLVSDRLALRASGFYAHDGGYIDNVARNAKDANRANIYGARADMLYTPSDKLSLRLTGFVQSIDRDGIGTADYALVGGAPVYGELAQSRPFAEPFNQDYRLGSATVAYDMDWATLNSVTSYQQNRSTTVVDASASYVPLLQAVFGRSYTGVGSISGDPFDKFTQELRLSGGNKHSLEWVLGGFYTYEDYELRAQLAALDLAGNQAPRDLSNTVAKTRFEEYAAFGTLTWHITDKFDISGGLRQLRHEEKFSQESNGAFYGGTLIRPETRASEDVTTYLANARYRFNDHATAYLRYATGYRPGGPNYLSRNPATGALVGPDSFTSDRLRNYEIGFKAETSDRRFGIDLSTYYIKWDDMIVYIIQPPLNGFLGNAAGGATVRGAELGLTARPVDALTITGGFAYLDAKMSEADIDLGAAKDERLPNVPRVSGNLNFTYAFSGSALEPRIGAGVRHVSDRHVSFDHSPFYPQAQIGAYTVADFRAGLTLHSIDFQVFLRNAFDKRGAVSAYTYSGLQPALIQPRTIGLSAAMRF